MDTRLNQKKEAEIKVNPIPITDFENCRFKLLDKNFRLYECVYHKEKLNISHGIRLHPPHLWRIKEDGRVFKIEDGKEIEWYKTLTKVK